jgi:ABC-type uncharacterized transport system permease subunit
MSTIRAQWVNAIYGIVTMVYLYSYHLDIIHRPVFYLKLNSTLYVCLYFSGNTLRRRYEPNKLMLSMGL